MEPRLAGSPWPRRAWVRSRHANNRRCPTGSARPGRPGQGVDGRLDFGHFHRSVEGELTFQPFRRCLCHKVTCPLSGAASTRYSTAIRCNHVVKELRRLKRGRAVHAWDECLLGAILGTGSVARHAYAQAIIIPPHHGRGTGARKPIGRPWRLARSESPPGQARSRLFFPQFGGYRMQSRALGFEFLIPPVHQPPLCIPGTPIPEAQVVEELDRQSTYKP